MNIEIIAVGSELLQGRDNADLVYLSKRLTGLGYTVTRAFTLRDDTDLIASAFREGLKRSSVVISTGGLGPTFDDVTRQALSKAIGRKLIFDKKVFKDIESLFIKRGVSCPPENRRQAYCFKSSRVLENLFGTAPGLWVKAGNRKAVVLLPGPPAELVPMFERFVLPGLLKRFAPPEVRFKNFYVCGLGESDVNHRITHLIKGPFPPGMNVDFTILANISIIELRIIVRGKDIKAIEDTVRRISVEVSRILGDYIYSEKELDLSGVLSKLLIKSKMTLSIAESCTGGMISDRITDIAGSSKYFLAGAITYGNEQKKSMLGVKKETLKKFGAVSKEVVLEMLKGIKRLSGSDCAIAVSGITGPSGGSREKPVGLVYVGASIPGSTEVKEYNFPGGRRRIKQITTNKAMNSLRLLLVKNKNKNYRSPE